MPADGGAPEPAQAVAALRPWEQAPAQRPHVLLNMVSTVDGRAAVGGLTAPMSGPADRQVFHGLRGLADAILVGAGTLRAERYGRLVKDPARRARRAAAGLAPDPLAVVLTASGELPWDAPLFADEHSRVLVLTRSGLRPPATAARVEVLPVQELGPALGVLRGEHGVRALLCEGGPGLNASLLRAGLVDELFLTVAALLGGDDHEPGIVTGRFLEAPQGLELVWVKRAGDELFLRYKVPAR